MEVAGMKEKPRFPQKICLEGKEEAWFPHLFLLSPPPFLSILFTFHPEHVSFFPLFLLRVGQNG